MKSRLTTALRHLTTAAALAVVAAAGAHEYQAGALTLVHPHAAPTPPGAETAAGYLGIRNAGPSADTLLGASSPRARKVELHEMSMDGGVMRMRALPQGLPVPAGGRVDLGPGGAHLMLIGIDKPFAAGDSVPLVLEFAKAGKVPVTLHVDVPAADGDAGMAGMHHAP